MLARLNAFLVSFLLTMLLTLPALALGGALEGAVTVFAAASAKPVLDALDPVLKARGVTLRLVYAGSSTLARQIEAGAPADIYVSANTAWMDYLANEGLLAPATRTNVATNQLVLIARDPLPAPLMAFGPGYPIASVLRNGRLAIADPDHVPAGLYARQALKAFGMWTEVQDQLALTRDVTGALLLVARGEARLGVVYASDAKRVPDVHVFAPFPEDSHAPIVYPAAIIQGRDSPAARQVLAALVGTEGQAAFRAAGFGAAP